MNLNITIQDLELGRWEAQKSLLLHRFVAKRKIIKDPERGRLPSHVVQSELLDLMVESCKKTGVIVVKAERGLGKSTAAKFILKNSAGGIMFCNCASTSSGSYWKGVARAVGIPKQVYENSSDWEELLVTAVAAATSPEELGTPSSNSWTNRLLDGLLSMCSGGGIEPLGDDSASSNPPPAIAGLDLSRVQKRPIMVFDDFNDVDKEDILFLKHLFPIVKANEILLFVLVRDKATANQLLKLNGWGRIEPLQGICIDASSPGDDEKEPEWRSVQWTRTQLQEIVLSRLGNIPEDMPEIEDGGNPMDVLDVAMVYDGTD